MLEKICPRKHHRLRGLPLLGSYVEAFAEWLLAEGYPLHPVKQRLRELPRVDEQLRRSGAVEVEALTAADILALAPEDSQDDIYLAAAVRSLSRFLSAQGRLRAIRPSPAEDLVATYEGHLDRVRGLAGTTRSHHAATAAELVAFVGYDGDPARLRAIRACDIEAFVRSVAPRVSRASLQHYIAYLRSFLRFLAGRGLMTSGLDTQIDTPRLYRGERLPRALPWEVVQDFLRAIDRSTPMGKRDYAMFLLVATYGLRTCEVAALTLDDVEWRAERMNVPRSKVGTPLALPLTEPIGEALVDYLRHARPKLPHREIFLRVRAPEGPLRPTAVTEAFQGWTRRSGLSIPYQGPHCLRHALAVHLLRQGTPLKTIGDLLGHRSAESTCVYLRLHVEDLRDVALSLPVEVQP